VTSSVNSNWVSDPGPATDFVLDGRQASDVNGVLTVPVPPSGDTSGTTDQASILAAVATVAARGGGVVELRGGTYFLASDVVINQSGVVIRGVGAPSGIFQGAPTIGTILKRAGFTAGDVIRFETPTGAATAISGCGLENLSIVGNNVANKGLVLKSVQWSTFKNLHIRNCVVVALDMFIETNITDLVEDTQGNILERISITQTSSASGIGVRLDGTSPQGNTSLNSFERLSVLHTNGVGIQFLNADSNKLDSTLVTRAGGGTGIGIEFNGSATLNAGHSRSNMLYQVDAGAGGVTARGAGLTQASVNNKIYGYSRENGAPAPVIESGATLEVFGDTGAVTGLTSFVKDDFAAGSTGSTAVGELGWTVTNGTLTTLTAEQNHPGIFNHAVLTSAQVAHLRLGGANDGDILPANFFDVTFIVRLNNNDTATDVRFGLGSASGTAPPAAGIWIEKAFADTSWFGVNRSAGSQSRTSALAAVTGNFVRLRMRRKSATLIAFSVDGGAEQTLAGNIPTAALAFYTQISNNNGVSKSFDIDYFDCTYSGLVR
jgi:hypothetical protein